MLMKARFEAGASSSPDESDALLRCPPKIGPGSRKPSLRSSYKEYSENMNRFTGKPIVGFLMHEAGP